MRASAITWLTTVLVCVAQGGSGCGGSQSDATPLTANHRADEIVKCLTKANIGIAGLRPSKKHSARVLLVPADRDEGVVIIAIDPNGETATVAHFDASKALLDQVMECIPLGRGLTRRETVNVLGKLNRSSTSP